MTNRRPISRPIFRSAPAAAALLLTGIAAGQGANDCISAQALKGYGTFPFSTVGATTDGAADVLCRLRGRRANHCR